MRIHVHTGFSVCLDDEEDGSARPRKCVGVAKISQYFVCINTFLHTYMYIIYMCINAHTCTYRISYVPWWWWGSISAFLRTRGCNSNDQYFVCINIYLQTYIYIIYMYINAHTCIYRIFRMSWWWWEWISASPRTRGCHSNESGLRVYQYILTYIHLHYVHVYKCTCMHTQDLPCFLMMMKIQRVPANARVRVSLK